MNENGDFHRKLEITTSGQRHFHPALRNPSRRGQRQLCVHLQNGRGPPDGVEEPEVRGEL